MIYLASDHRGFELKEKIKTWLSEAEYEFQDMGPTTLNPEDDYPDFVRPAAEKVSANPKQHRAIVLGGSGQGEAMVANRFTGVRAAVFYGPAQSESEDIIRLSREHNDANVLSLGASFLDDATAREAILAWLATPFSDEARHKRRIRKIEKSEQKTENS